MFEELSFTAIDFETANPRHASACSVGLSKVRAGRVVETVGWYIKPAPGLDDFSPWNVRVHGITPVDVANSRMWPEMYGAMTDFIGGDPLVAHNASFERSVITKSAIFFGLPELRIDYYCTLKLAQRHLTLEKYTLPSVMNALRLPEFAHHQAGEDALAAARIVLALADRTGLSDFGRLWAGAR